MIKLTFALLCICILLIISMWLCLSGQIIGMEEELSYIRSTVNCINDNDYYVIRDDINDLEKTFTVKIANLADLMIKNKDTKQVKRDFQEWDVFKFGHDEYVIYHIEQCSNNRKLYRCLNNRGGSFGFYDSELISAEFIKSASPWVEEVTE